MAKKRPDPSEFEFESNVKGGRAAGTWEWELYLKRAVVSIRSGKVKGPRQKAEEAISEAKIQFIDDYPESYEKLDRAKRGKYV
jgi:hypothetical protein